MSIVDSNQWGQAKEEINKNALPRTGGKMIGNIDMDSNNISNLGKAVNDGDALNMATLKTLRPFSMQIITTTLDCGSNPTGDTEIEIALNPEFNQKFNKFVLIGLNKTYTQCMPKDGSLNYVFYSYNSGFSSVGMKVEYIEDSLCFKFSVSSSDGTRDSILQSAIFLVIGLI